MTRETKAGLLMVVMLGGVFGFMVYKRMNQSSEAMAQQPLAAAEQPDVPDSAESAGTTNDPFLQETGGGAPASEVITAAAAEPAPFADENPSPRAAASTETAAASEPDPFEQQEPAPEKEKKPRLPTAVPDDVAELVPTRAKPASEPAQAAASTAEFDPFSASDAAPRADSKTAASPAPAAIPDDRPTAQTLESDSFPSKAPVADRTAPVEFTDSNDPFSDPATPATTKAATPTATPANRAPTPLPSGEFEAPGQFEAPVVVTPKTAEARSDAFSSDSAADPFAETAKPADLPPETRTPPVNDVPTVGGNDPFEKQPAFEPQQSSPQQPSAQQPSPQPSSPQAAVLEQSIEDALNDVPLKSAVPTLKIPSRDSLPVEDVAPAGDDRFGGFRPATPGEPAASAAPEVRPAAPTIVEGDAPRRQSRPAAVTQIDEDFGAKPAARPLVAGDTYQIEPNDNYWTISRKKYGTGRYFMALAQHNAQVIPDPKRMRPGVTIATPAADALEQTYPQLIPKAAGVDPVQTASVSDASPVTMSETSRTTVKTAHAEADAGFFVGSDGAPMYRVGAEDTLSGIAQRHLGRSSRWVQVFEMNREILKDGNTLKIGSTLRLPADASQVEVVGGGRTFR